MDTDAERKYHQQLPQIDWPRTNFNRYVLYIPLFITIKHLPGYIASFRIYFSYILNGEVENSLRSQNTSVVLLGSRLSVPFFGVHLGSAIDAFQL